LLLDFLLLLLCKNCLELLLELHVWSDCCVSLRCWLSSYRCCCYVQNWEDSCTSSCCYVKEFTVDFFLLLWNKCYSCFWRNTTEVAAAAGRTASILCRCYCSETDVASSSTVFATAKSLLSLLHMIFFSLLSQLYTNY
jgi:hypothetical protein